MSLANDVSEIGSVPPPPSSSLPFPSHADLRQFQSPLRRRILLRRRRSPHWEPDRGGDPGGCEGELSRAVRVCGRSEFGGVWVVGGCEEDAGEEEGVSGGLGGGGFREGFFFSSTQERYKPRLSLKLKCVNLQCSSSPPQLNIDPTLRTHPDKVTAIHHRLELRLGGLKADPRDHPPRRAPHALDQSSQKRTVKGT